MPKQIITAPEHFLDLLPSDIDRLKNDLMDIGAYKVLERVSAFLMSYKKSSVHDLDDIKKVIAQLYGAGLWKVVRPAFFVRHIAPYLNQDVLGAVAFVLRVPVDEAMADIKMQKGDGLAEMQSMLSRLGLDNAAAFILAVSTSAVETDKFATGVKRAVKRWKLEEHLLHTAGNPQGMVVYKTRVAGLSKKGRHLTKKAFAINVVDTKDVWGRDVVRFQMKDHRGRVKGVDKAENLVLVRAYTAKGARRGKDLAKYVIVPFTETEPAGRPKVGNSVTIRSAAPSSADLKFGFAKPAKKPHRRLESTKTK